MHDVFICCNRPISRRQLHTSPSNERMIHFHNKIQAFSIWSPFAEFTCDSGDCRNYFNTLEATEYTQWASWESTEETTKTNSCVSGLHVDELFLGSSIFRYLQTINSMNEKWNSITQVHNNRCTLCTAQNIALNRKCHILSNMYCGVHQNLPDTRRWTQFYAYTIGTFQTHKYNSVRVNWKENILKSKRNPIWLRCRCQFESNLISSIDYDALHDELVPLPVTCTCDVQT